MFSLSEGTWYQLLVKCCILCQIIFYCILPSLNLHLAHLNKRENSSASYCILALVKYIDHSKGFILSFSLVYSKPLGINAFLVVFHKLYNQLYYLNSGFQLCF